MRRREDEALNNGTLVANSPGIALTRNPGVVMLWTTDFFRVFNDGRGGALCSMGEPSSVQWYAYGRPATRAEVLESVESGLPALERVARLQAEQGALKQLEQMKARLAPLFPTV